MSDKKKTVQEAALELLQNEEEMNAILDRVVEKEKLRNKTMEEFWQSEEFDRQIQLLKDYGKVVDCEGLAYGVLEFKALTAEEFGFLHDTVYHHATEIIEDPDDDCCFEEQLTVYNGLVFRRLYGQGTALQVYPDDQRIEVSD